MVIYKVSIVRPTLAELNFIEFFYPTDSLWSPTVPGLSEPGIPNETFGNVSFSYAESITWAGLNTRKSELRPDLLTEFEAVGFGTISSNTNTYGTGPRWNPFSLSWTSLLTFDDKSKALLWIDTYVDPGVITNSVNATNNSIVYEELLIDDVPDTTFVKKYGSPT
jgi:hypothetical protein